MYGSELLELEHIVGLISSIESHWDFLQGNDPDWSLVPGVMLPAGFMNTLCENRRKSEELRKKALLDPDFKCPAWQILDALQGVIFTPAGSDESFEQLIARGVASDAYWLARKSMTEALTEAELNKLGWELTRLVAMGAEPLKTALRSIQVKGGVRSGESRRAENADRDKAICDLGRRLISEDRAMRNLAGIISETGTAEGLSTKQIRTILQAGGVVPAARKKGK